mmetsp:Transcript_76906/g.222281  ORF Transcript_76906/g.222281 Transcript_76906/m.222281 type:complete len:234 (-) Transcript_76906:1186-1887(-)
MPAAIVRASLDIALGSHVAGWACDIAASRAAEAHIAGADPVHAQAVARAVKWADLKLLVQSQAGACRAAPTIVASALPGRVRRWLGADAVAAASAGALWVTAIRALPTLIANALAVPANAMLGARHRAHRVRASVRRRGVCGVCGGHLLRFNAPTRSANASPRLANAVPAAILSGLQESRAAFHVTHCAPPQVEALAFSEAFIASAVARTETISATDFPTGVPREFGSRGFFC